MNGKEQARGERLGGGLGATARLRKIRAMSPREIGARLGDRAFAAVERFRHARGRFHDPARLGASLRSDLSGAADWQERLLAERRAPKARFYPGLDNRDGMRRIFETLYRTEHDNLLVQAERARRHEFEFFGTTFRYGDRVNWHADPVSGREWPHVYHEQVPVHAGDIGFGDVKYVWELNRHQFLIDLGKSYYLDGNQAHAAAAIDLVSDWIAHNSYGTGVSWACALEPAFRAYSWLWAYSFCLDADALTAQRHLEWLAGFHDHGHFLYRHLECYSSPFNHLVGEAAALYALGVLFPEFREAARWRRRGRQVLESRLHSQFHADGGTVEQSTFYHHASLGFYILAALLGRRNGEDFSPAVWQAIERGIEFSMHVVQPDGFVPAIGGADDGKPIRMEHLPFWDFRPYQALGAVLFGRADFKYVAGRFHEDALWLLGSEGVERFSRTPSEPPRQTHIALRDSGYVLMRTGWSETADYLCFDCGEQAAGARTDDVPSAVHGHADCLSVAVCLGGRRVLVDPGFFCYNGDSKWEVHFRKTGAHNTARVDGADQARHLAKMAWSHAYTPHLEAWVPDAGQAYVIASHDGYARHPNGVLHRRIAWMRPGGYVVLYDEFVGEGDHDLELTFQLAPGAASLAEGGGGLLFDAGVELCWHGSSAWSPRLQQGGTEPDEGWIAASLGVRVPAPKLALTSHFASPRTTCLTVLADRRSTGGMPRVRRGAEPAAAGVVVAVGGSDYTDWILAGGPTEPVGSAGIETDATLAICRIRHDHSVEAVRIGGTYLRLLDASVPVAGREPAAAGH